MKIDYFCTRCARYLYRYEKKQCMTNHNHEVVSKEQLIEILRRTKK